MGTEKRERQKANKALGQQQAQQAATRRKTLRTVGIVVAAVVGLILFVWIASNVVGGDDDPSTPVPTEPAVTETVPTETTPDASAPVTTDA